MVYNDIDSSNKCKDVNLSVLTYNIKHRKTYDILCLLKALGYENVFVYAMALQYKKTFQPILQHRPEMTWQIDTEMLCRNFLYKYCEIESYDEIKQHDNSIILIGGAVLLPDEFVKKYRIINAHPGYIPNSRGLDAYKWAIYEKQPIGVTAHLVGEEIDAGEVILRKKVSVYKNDTFYSLAQRVYENEIKIMVEAIPHTIKNKDMAYISGDGYIVHKRMPKDIERGLLDAFEEYKAGVVENGIS